MLDQPAGVVVGDVLVAGVVLDGNGSIFGDVSAEWTTVQTANVGNTLGLRVYQRTVTATTATYTFPVGGADGTGGIIGLRCVTATGLLSAGATGTGTMTAPSLTPTAADSLLVSVFGSEADDAAHDTPTGMTAAFASSAVAYRSSAATQALPTTAPTGTCSAGATLRNTPWVAVSVVLPPLR